VREDRSLLKVSASWWQLTKQPAVPALSLSLPLLAVGVQKGMRVMKAAAPAK